MSGVIWWKGRVVAKDEATVSVTSETSLRAINAFEGLRAYWRPQEGRHVVVSLGDHLRRLGESLAILRMPAEELVEPLGGAVRALIRAVAREEDLYLRPTVYLDQGPYTADPELMSFGSFVSCAPARSSERPLACHVSTRPRVPSASFPARAKSGAAYAMFRLARLEATALGYDEAILLDGEGNVTETGGASIFVVSGGAVATPGLSADILDSITRRHALAILRGRLGHAVEERPVSVRELLEAEEVFVTGTLDEVRRVARVAGGRPELGREVGQAVRAEYLAMCSGAAAPLAAAMFVPVPSDASAA